VASTLDANGTLPSRRSRRNVAQSLPATPFRVATTSSKVYGFFVFHPPS
jgi:hypothetical protein